MSGDADGWGVVFVTIAIAFMIVWSALRGEIDQAIAFAELGAVTTLGFGALLIFGPKAEDAGQYIREWRSRRDSEVDP